MKGIFLIFIVACCPRIAASQDTINPYNIQQPMTIILQNTDVYYNPFAPPSDSDTRANLCNESDQLRDSDALGNQYRLYLPVVYNTVTHRLDTLMNWAPCGTPLGQFATWQRLFQAKRKPDGTPTDIIAGSNVVPPDTIITLGLDGYPPDTDIVHPPTGPVIISKNEDVDFRASGRIKLKSGFKVMPGAFFHAYTEPKWGDSVFADEFNDTAKFNNQWHVNNGWGDYYAQGADCSSDSNVRLVPDSDAHDGWALDITLREDTVDTCNCFQLGGKYIDSCESVPSTSDTTPQKYLFSTAILRSCPYPDSQRVVTPIASSYPRGPYGKYEIREKIPHTEHHTNNWGSGYGFEWDLNETDNGNMDIINPNFNHTFRYGPCTGHFGTDSGIVIFVSTQAGWCLSNNPEAIIINNVPYHVQLFPGHGMDTVIAENDYYQPPWPSSITSSTDSVTFDYTVLGNCISDSLPWRVDTDAYGKWRIFSGAYHDSSGHLLHFSKWNQPTAITLTTDTIFHDSATFHCHWEYNLNHPNDSGKLYLDDTMSPSNIHSFTQRYSFDRRVLYSPHENYPVATLPFNGNDTAGGYEYHTFAMEWLPHEIRYLVDSVVVRRFPDRLVPKGNPYYDWISTMPRSLASIRPAEVDMDANSNNFDLYGTDDTVAYTYDGVTFYKSINYQERHYFETHTGNPGFWPVDGKPAAHHLIDYIKVWDVPADVKIPDLPH
jgi:hypothetical protein